MNTMMTKSVVWAVIVVLAIGSTAVAIPDPRATDCLGMSSVDESGVTDDTRDILNAGERQFAVHLVKKIFGNFDGNGIDTNIFVSPASIFQTMMLSYMGAKGETETDLAAFLTGDNKDALTRTDIIKNYLYEREFQSQRESNPESGYTLTYANKFYFDRSLNLDQCLQHVLREELEALDFSNIGKTRGVINDWVKEKTQKRIPELLSPGSLDESNKVVLVNAAYFKGQWQSKFEQSNTATGNFYVTRDKIRMTKFMEQEGQFNYYASEELRAHFLELPYVGDDVSLIIILPPFEDNSLFETVDKLTPEKLSSAMAELRSGFFSVEDLKVKIPRFTIEQSWDLGETLSNLGLQSLFDSPESDLSGFLADGENKEEIKLNKATHKSFIEVNEEGSEAAAASAVFGFRSARPLFHTEFIADHPFLFFIYDKPSDTILFFGVFQDPKL